MESWIFKYAIAGADVPAELRLVFMKEHPWLEELVVVRNKVIDLDAEASGFDNLFNGVLLGIGAITQSGTDKNGQPILNVQYEILGVPPHLEAVFQNVVAGKGKTFDALKKLVDALVSSLVNEVYLETVQDMEKGELDKPKEESKILTPEKSVILLK